LLRQYTFAEKGKKAKKAKRGKKKRKGKSRKRFYLRWRGKKKKRVARVSIRPVGKGGGGEKKCEKGGKKIGFSPHGMRPSDEKKKGERNNNTKKRRGRGVEILMPLIFKRVVKRDILGEKKMGRGNLNPQISYQLKKKGKEK